MRVGGGVVFGSQVYEDLVADLSHMFPADAMAVARRQRRPLITHYYEFGIEGSSGCKMVMFTFDELGMAKGAEECLYNWREWSQEKKEKADRRERAAAARQGRRPVLDDDAGWDWWSVAFLHPEEKRGDVVADAPDAAITGPCGPSDRPVLHGQETLSRNLAAAAGLTQGPHGIPPMGWFPGRLSNFWPKGYGKGGPWARSDSTWGGRQWREPHEIPEEVEEEKEADPRAELRAGVWV